MDASFNDIIFSKHLLQSKHLVVVLGTKPVIAISRPPLTSQAGAGVSKAAGIPPFRGPGGLFNFSSKAGSMLDLFDKDTFQVRSQLMLLEV